MERIKALDIVRGAALSGILLVNAPAMLDLPGGIVDGQLNPVRHILDMTVQQRFFPVFSLLFGIGFGLMWMSAEARAVRPRLVMLRRILLLGVLGAVHQLLQPGEALLPYAVAALVVLLPATWLPAAGRWRAVPAVGGFAATAAGLVAGGGLALIPGLFLLGFSGATTGLVQRLVSQPRALALLTCLAATAAGPALWWQAQDPLSAGFNLASAVAGLALATVYVGGICLLLHSRLEGPLSAVFTPLGRMALTNYVSATVILVAVHSLPLPGGGTSQDLLFNSDPTANWLSMIGLCVTILAAQVAMSRMWLSRFGQGPLERIWRSITWFREREVTIDEARTGKHRQVVAAQSVQMSRPTTGKFTKLGAFESSGM